MSVFCSTFKSKWLPVKCKIAVNYGTAAVGNNLVKVRGLRQGETWVYKQLVTPSNRAQDLAVHLSEPTILLVYPLFPCLGYLL
jgi:hypothetical protein